MPHEPRHLPPDPDLSPLAFDAVSLVSERAGNPERRRVADAQRGGVLRLDAAPLRAPGLLGRSAVEALGVEAVGDGEGVHGVSSSLFFGHGSQKPMKPEGPLSSHASCTALHRQTRPRTYWWSHQGRWSRTKRKSLTTLPPSPQTAATATAREWPSATPA